MNAVIYQAVTDRIVTALDAGVVPWRKPWQTGLRLPANGLSNRSYRGVNALLLGFSPYTDPRWVTLLQANQLGGSVTAGEKSTTIVFWKQEDVTVTDEESGEEVRKRLPLLKTYSVFNVEQCEELSIQPLSPKRGIPEHERIARAESLVASMTDRPEIVEGGTQAWYRPRDDRVEVPSIQSFETADSYYATLFHELGHATGHEKRLKRPGVTDTVRFGSGDYGQEELVAEICSALCCATASLDNSLIENSASYIYSWIATLKGNPKMVLLAAGQAQKAADWIFGTVSMY